MPLENSVEMKGLISRVTRGRSAWPKCTAQQAISTSQGRLKEKKGSPVDDLNGGVAAGIREASQMTFNLY